MNGRPPGGQDPPRSGGTAAALAGGPQPDVRGAAPDEIRRADPEDSQPADGMGAGGLDLEVGEGGSVMLRLPPL